MLSSAATSGSMWSAAAVGGSPKHFNNQVDAYHALILVHYYDLRGQALSTRHTFCPLQTYSEMHS